MEPIYPQSATLCAKQSMLGAKRLRVGGEGREQRNIMLKFVCQTVDSLNRHVGFTHAD